MSHAWCQQIVEGLRAAGVQDLVVSPGSRSTPILLAALDSKLRLHSVIDERSAAFFALGKARAEQRPVALLCTSGSAGAHYLPALLEARYAGHRLVAITADRPPELQDCGANQTIDQVPLFVAACPPCVQLGIAEEGQDALLALRRRVQQSIASAAGPVHINAPFRKPLEPTAGDSDGSGAGRAALPFFPAGQTASQEALDHVLQLCASAQRGVIVAGPSTNQRLGPTLRTLAEATGFVLLAESSSNARFRGDASEHRCDAFPLVLGNEALAQGLVPDLVLQFGLEPACGALSRWLQACDADWLRFCDGRKLGDSQGRSQQVFGDSANACERLIEALPKGDDGGDYRRAWRQADERAWSAVSCELQSEGAMQSEAHAIATLLPSLPEGAQLTVGNSMPIRALDSVLPGHRASLRILHQRGTSGIDGLIAGSIGSSGPSFSALLLGDVSCAHDLSSLALAPMCPGPLAIVAIDNQGGQIFSHLPVSALALSQTSWDFWQTSPNLDLETLCRGYGVAYKRATKSSDMTEAVQWAQSQRGVCFVHVVVDPGSMRSFLLNVQKHLEASAG